jgi:hypothetical protein
MLRTRASRLGLLVTAIGLGLLIYNLYTFQPRNSQRPESPQHRELVLKLEKDAADRGRKLLADAFAGKAISDCAPSDDECLMLKDLDEMGMSTRAADMWARWTPDTYIHAWGKNIANGLRSSRSFLIAVSCFLLGLYLLLLHEFTIGRIVNWIQHGNKA